MAIRRLPESIGMKRVKKYRKEEKEEKGRHKWKQLCVYTNRNLGCLGRVKRTLCRTSPVQTVSAGAVTL
jgi:hypothetical protein